MSSEDDKLSEELARRLAEEELGLCSSEVMDTFPVDEVATAQLIAETDYDADLALALALQEEFNTEVHQSEEQFEPFSIGGGGTEPDRSRPINPERQSRIVGDTESPDSEMMDEANQGPKRLQTGAWAKRPNLPRNKSDDVSPLTNEECEEALYQSLRGKAVARRPQVFRDPSNVSNIDADSAALIQAIIAAQEEGYDDEEIEEMLGGPNAAARAAGVTAESNTDPNYEFVGLLESDLSTLITKHDKSLTGRRLARNMERILGSYAGNLQDIEESTYFQNLHKNRQKPRASLAGSHAAPHHATLTQSSISSVQRHLAKQTRKGHAARGRVEKETWATQGAVLDNRTRMILFKILSSGVFESVAGCLKEGKEAAIFLGLNWDHRLHMHIAGGGTATSFEEMHLRKQHRAHQSSGEDHEDGEEDDEEEPVESHEIRRSGQCMYCWPEFVTEDPTKSESEGVDALDGVEVEKPVQSAVVSRSREEGESHSQSDVGSQEDSQALGLPSSTSASTDTGVVHSEASKETGQRPDLHMTKEKSVEADNSVESENANETEDTNEAEVSTEPPLPPETLQSLEDRISERDLSKTVRFDEGVQVHNVESEHPFQEERATLDTENAPRGGRDANKDVFAPMNMSVSGHQKVVVAIKIYRTSRNRFKNRGEYIQSDRRYAFTTVTKQSSRDLINLWAQKEYQNLVRVHRAGIPSPAPLLLNGHVLIMSLIGTEANPAPQLRNAGLVGMRQWSRAYLQVIMILYAMYQWCHLVHGDFTEFNILWYKRRAYVIDFGHAVDTSHALSDEFLEKDIANITRFFKTKGALTLPEDMLFNLVKNSAFLPHPTSHTAFRTGSRLGRVPLSGSGIRRSKAQILKESQDAPYDVELESHYKKYLERSKQSKLAEQDEESHSDSKEDTDDASSAQSMDDMQTALRDATNIVLDTSGGKVRFVPRDQVHLVDVDAGLYDEFEDEDHFDGKSGPVVRYAMKKFRELGLLV